MTSTACTPPEPASHNELLLAQVRARRLSAVANLVFGFIILLSIGVAGVSAIRSNDIARRAAVQAEANYVLIESLTADLAETRDLLAAKTDVHQEVDDCSAALSAKVRDAFRDTFGDLTDLTVLITTTAPADQPALAGEILAQLTESRAEYRAVTDTSNAWLLLPLDQRLPCPA